MVKMIYVGNEKKMFKGKERVKGDIVDFEPHELDRLDRNEWALAPKRTVRKSITKEVDEDGEGLAGEGDNGKD